MIWKSPPLSSEQQRGRAGKVPHQHRSLPEGKSSQVEHAAWHSDKLPLHLIAPCIVLWAPLLINAGYYDTPTPELNAVMGRTNLSKYTASLRVCQYPFMGPDRGRKIGLRRPDCVRNSLARMPLFRKHHGLTICAHL